MKLDNILTEEDIKKSLKIIGKSLLQKDFEEFRKEMKKSFSDSQTSVDADAKKVDTYTQEMIMLAHKVDRHEK